ncbi:DUF6332 family protein [Streptomyces sp. BI20]|uniref:DUF6332 family protein n=1 Tax=Streptomyces sp. BI20 TaxID=3403460 RepID=UPI003C75677D
MTGDHGTDGAVAVTDAEERQARRDAATVEIGFALVTGVLLGGLVLLVLLAPMLRWQPGSVAAEQVWTWTAVGIAALVCVWRVVRVLWRFDPSRR